LWWFSPHCFFALYCFVVFIGLVVGEITQDGGDIITLVLPSVFLLSIPIVIRVGEITQEKRRYYYSRSPLSEPKTVGEIHRVDF